MASRVAGLFGKLAAAMLMVTGNAAAAQTSPTIKQLISLENVDTPRISPDGRAVAYLLSTADWAKNAYQTEIWSVDVATGTRRELTAAAGSSRHPRWTPDGREVAFLSNRSGPSQIYVVAATGGTPRQLTQAPGGVTAFEWSPDGSRIAFTTEEALPAPSAVQQGYRLVGREARQTSRLWLMDIGAAGAAIAPPASLTDGRSFAVDAFTWSPDSARIAFHASDPSAQYEFWSYDIFVLRLADRAVTRIVDTPGPDFFPIWSPDGAQIAYRTYARTPGDEYNTYDIGYVATVRASGGAPRILSAGFDEQATAVAWTREGIYFAGRQGPFQQLFLLNPTSGRHSRVTPPGRMAAAFSFSRDFDRAAFMGADPDSYQEIHVSPLRSFRPKRLTNMGAQLSRWKLGRRELIQWTSTDGTPIEGVLIKPPDYQPGRRYPLVVILHSGPLEVDQPTFTRDLPHPAEAFAAKGALVLRPNYRGSIGYGQGFREALVRNLGKPQAADVLSGVDELVRRGMADPARTGVMGWSHGGYLSAFLATATDRFRAASVGQGTSDWRTFYTLGAGGTLKPGTEYLQKSPWDDPDYYRETSPLSYVKQARTPTLIQHGDMDTIVPIGSAQELFRGLKDQNVPVEMIVYTGAGHLPSGLRQAQDVAEHNLAWFSHWLWDEPLGPPYEKAMPP